MHLWDRRLVAVMFTEMVGYTALIQKDERLAVGKRDRFLESVERHHDANRSWTIRQSPCSWSEPELRRACSP